MWPYSGHSRRFASEGEFYPFRDEANDVNDTVEWAAHCRIPMERSACGARHMSALARCWRQWRTPTPGRDLAVVTGSNYHDGWIYQGGAFEQMFTNRGLLVWRRTRFSHYLGRNTLRLWRSGSSERLCAFQFSSAHRRSQFERDDCAFTFTMAGTSELRRLLEALVRSEHFADINVPALNVALV